MTPEWLPDNYQIIGRYSPPYACQTPTFRLPFPLPLERETYAKGTRRVGESKAKPLRCLQIIEFLCQNYTSLIAEKQFIFAFW